jgi:hypothetical protein
MRILLPYYLFLILLLYSGVVPYGVLPVALSVLFSLSILLLSYVIGKVKPISPFPVKFSPPRRLHLLVFLYILCSIVYVDFYTGLDPLTIVSNIIDGKSNYSLYQEYFKENVAEFSSLDKLPFILAGVYLKVVVFASFVYFRRGTIGPFLFTFILLIYLSGGLARGTNFEVFELLLMFFFHYFWIGRAAINYKFLIWALVLLLLCLFIFLYFVEERGNLGTCITPDLCTNSTDNVINRILLLLNGYFGFGFYFIGVFLLNVDVFTLAFGSLSPSWLLFCGPIIDCGVAWTPLFADLVSFAGLPVTFLLICLALYIFFKLRFSCSLHTQMFCFWFFLFLISLPVGKFIYISSANLLFPFAAFFLYSIRFDKVLK